MILRPSDGKPPKRVAFIQCVGSRDANENLYCSRICCMASIKHAHQVKEKYPEAETCIFYIDLRAFGKGYEEFLERSQREGIRLIRGRIAEIAELPETETLLVRYEDTLRNQIMEAEFDMVVLATALIPRLDTVELQKMLKLSLGYDGFFIEAHPKLRPVETYVPGIYLCGAAQGPKDIPDTVAQASAAASQASIPLLAGKVTAEPLTAYLVEDYCGGCGICVAVCPYNSISLVKTENGKWKAEVNEALCQGCGSCSAACPARAIIMRGYTEPQLLAQLKALLSV
ncbi:TPA: CoB--CoM heterodisulfide reductase iron-sulfur subunit A family protein [Candidatus Bathyarchaeota archaeon]|nr:CoB--CoM heterodisulfide reductase iron-sulfur subunit A family protein [Candidatus Bathyarchaeota archaeon]